MASKDKVEDSWKSKQPADMTNDELQAAKTAVAALLGPTQEALNGYAAAMTNIDAIIYQRFGIPGAANVGNMPSWPAEVIATLPDSTE